MAGMQAEADKAWRAPAPVPTGDSCDAGAGYELLPAAVKASHHHDAEL
jgi:hypothetical protein